MLTTHIAQQEIRETMELVSNIESIKKPYHNAVLTIGNFDGVHIGHQVLFREVKKKADQINGTSIAMTFEPHPSRVIKQNAYPPLITLYEQKLELISKHNLDVLISVPFTKAFAEISAQEFVEDLLVDRIGMKAIVVGKDYAFGKNREGNLDFLKGSSNRLGFDVVVWDWVPDSENRFDRVSSTKIRELVMDGNVAGARQPLGRYYQIRGTVERGRDRGGKLLGFPTANIHLTDELCPKMGVYAVTVECEGRFYNGVANIGYSPTFEDKIFTVEVHILDFNMDIYDKNIRVNFIERLRDEVKFSSLSQLKDQIKKDIEKAKRILDR